jgi:hypothetical protein
MKLKSSSTEILKNGSRYKNLYIIQNTDLITIYSSYLKYLMWKISIETRVKNNYDLHSLIYVMGLIL